MSRLLTATLAIVLSVSLFARVAESDGLPNGTLAPPIALFDRNGNYFDETAIPGQYVVINFWAFWCDTWKKEMSGLSVLAADQTADHFKLLAISVDGTRLPLFVRNTGGAPIPFPVLLDINGIVSKTYNIHHVPTIVIVDSAGKVRYTTYGFPGAHVVLSKLRTIESNDQK